MQPSESGHLDQLVRPTGILGVVETWEPPCGSRVSLRATVYRYCKPGKAIGKGIYNYLVSVYYPDERMVVQGAKVTFADRVTW